MNTATWSTRHPGQHESTCTCDECESYRKNEAASIERQVARGEWAGNTVVTGMDKEAAIIEQINAMPVEQWFTSVDVAGKPHHPTSHTLWTMAEVGQTNGEYVLIIAGGYANRYMWTNAAKWNEATQ